MKNIKFRMWANGRYFHDPMEVMECLKQQMLYDWGMRSNPFAFDHVRKTGAAFEQYTGLHDMNGVEIFNGDLLNVFFTSSNWLHIHDCVYSVILGEMGDINLRFQKLLWESYGFNQFPTSTTICLKYRNIDSFYDNGFFKLKIPETYGRNDLLRREWKEIDGSKYIEVIGNIHQNPELLK